MYRCPLGGLPYGLTVMTILIWKKVSLVIEDASMACYECGKLKIFGRLGLLLHDGCPQPKFNTTLLHQADACYVM